MAEEGKEEALFKRIESLGLQLSYESGFLVVTREASADQRRDDDDGELEEALLEQLGKHLPDVARIAVGKSRGTRGRDFLDRQVFIPSLKMFGRLTSFSDEGLAEVRYRRQSFKDPEVDVDAIHSGAGSDLVLILEECPAPLSQTSFTWISDERLRRLFERADQAGLRPEHDSGLTVVKWRAIDGVEREAVEGIVRELGAKLSEVSVRLAGRTRGERGANFVGRRVLVPAFFNSFGTIESVNSDGGVTVNYADPHTGSQRSCWAQGGDVLVVPDQQSAAEPTSAGQKSETAWQRLLRRVFGD
jgi:hypothetical protein